MSCDAHELSPAALVELLASGSPPMLIDVREPDEHAAGAIQGSRLIPLSLLVSTAQRESRIGGLERAREEVAKLVAPMSHSEEAVLYCEHGVRSEHALALLRQCGFDRLRHLAGGYAAWRPYSRVR